MGPEAGKPVRRAATTDRLPELVGQPGSARADAPKASPGTTAKVLLPALRELASGLGTQHDLVKEMLAAVQVGPLVALAFAQRPNPCLQLRRAISRSHCASHTALSAQTRLALETTYLNALRRWSCCGSGHALQYAVL